MPLAARLTRALVLLAALAAAVPAYAQLTMVQSGYYSTLVDGDIASKQIETLWPPGSPGDPPPPGGPCDTCLVVASVDGNLYRLCAGSGPALIGGGFSFIAGLACSPGGAYGDGFFVADFGSGDISRVNGGVTTFFATPAEYPASLVFDPTGSYGGGMIVASAFASPIYKVSSAGVVTPWADITSCYIKFGPGGAWGTGLYGTYYAFTPPNGSGVVRIAPNGTTSGLIEIFNPEGFDWGFGGDMFITDVSLGEIWRVTSGGTKTLFATLNGAADVAWRPSEQTLYVASNLGGLYRIREGSATDAPRGADASVAARAFPNPARAATTLAFVLPRSGPTRVDILDLAGRRVRELSSAWRSAGPQRVAWDGRDDAGVGVAAGGYLWRARSGGFTTGGRVSIVR